MLLAREGGAEASWCARRDAAMLCHASSTADRRDRSRPNSLVAMPSPVQLRGTTLRVLSAPYSRCLLRAAVLLLFALIGISWPTLECGHPKPLGVLHVLVRFAPHSARTILEDWPLPRAVARVILRGRAL